jgi:phenylacetate-CoA ligase
MDRTQGFYHEHETDSATARAIRQWQALQAVTARAASFDGEFRERLGAASIVPDEIRSLEDFTSIPVLRKKDLSRLQREKGLSWFLPCAPGELSRIYQSPGPIYRPRADAQTTGLGPRLRRGLPQTFPPPYPPPPR